MAPSDDRPGVAAGRGAGRERVLVVDAANVVGARPDGWWRDRVAAAGRLLAGLARAVEGGAAELAGRVVVVLEGRPAAAGAGLPSDARLEVVRAARDGDGAVVDVVAAHAADDVVVVTSDRELRRRVAALGADVRGAGWLWDVLDRTAPAEGAPGR